MTDPGPKLTLSFDMVHHKNEYKLAIYGSDFWQTLYDIDQKCRNHLYYDNNTGALKGLLEITEIIGDCSAFHDIE